MSLIFFKRSFLINFAVVRITISVLILSGPAISSERRVMGYYYVMIIMLVAVHDFGMTRNCKYPLNHKTTSAHGILNRTSMVGIEATSNH